MGTLANSIILCPIFIFWTSSYCKPSERLQESINPELGIEKSRQRARKTWKSQEKSEDWIAKREQGIDIRKIYVDTLLEHDVKAGYEVAKCTNYIYKGIFKKDKAQLEEELRSQNPNLPKTVNIRDHAKLSSLSAIIALAEALSSEAIQEDIKSGVHECSQVYYEQGQSVGLALDDSKKRRNCISDIF